MTIDFDDIHMQEVIDRIALKADLSFGTETIQVKLDLDSIARQILHIAKRDVKVEIWSGNCVTTLEPHYKEVTSRMFDKFKEVKEL